MADFFFKVQNGNCALAAEDGVDLPDPAVAKSYAIKVARELMRGDELNKRSWRMDVLDEGRQVVVALPFAVVDPTLDHLRPDLRALIERLCETRRACEETLLRFDSLLVWVQAMRGALTRRPCLVTRDGQRV